MGMTGIEVWAGKSKAIERAIYDHRSLTLEITFKRGNVLRYTGVGGATWEEFLCAKSKGAYYQKHIRGHYYSVQPVEGTVERPGPTI